MSRPRPKALPLLLAGVLIGVSGSLQARDEDRDQPAHIEADRLDMDNQKEVSVYQGNVVFTQGSTRVSGDRVTLRTEAGEVRHLLIEGNPARYEEISNAGQPVEARGLEIEYDAANNRVRIEGEAALTRPGESFTGERILYVTDTEVISARGSTEDQGEGRVRIVIQPGSRTDN